MINLELQRKNFENHVATLQDLGNIKVLDFKNPNSSNYRIRFIFEEDYCRCHISGDLGELIATNYNNMTFEGFTDFIHNAGYFEEKIDCHSRRIYEWDEDKARDELKEYFQNCEAIEEIIENSIYDSEEEAVEDFLDDVMVDFDTNSGLGSIGLEKLSDIFPDIYYERPDRFGREETGILELYMLAFELATKQLKGDA